ncbi:MAG: InlB B-repeat-containing protein, partial [Chitinispirillales bacterium]|nr:InlB B-repeat-containing protein [Chitinispirillales bacterium]
MTGLKKITYKSIGLLICFFTASLLLTCEKIPDFCGDPGSWYDPEFQFCRSGRPFYLCAGKEFDPRIQGCDPEKNDVGTLCLGDTFVPVGTPCNGFTLSIAAAPPEGGSVTVIRTSPEGQNFDADELVALNAIAAEGYEFAGWAGAETSMSSNITFRMDSNRPLVAMFEPISENDEHRLATTAFPAHGGTITRNPDAPHYNTGTSVTVTATKAAGFAFSGWSGASTSTDSTITVTVDEGKTLVAMFTPVEYTLTVNSNPEIGGTVFVNGTALAGASRQDAGRVEVLAQPADGYVFVNWSGARTGTDNPVTIDNITSNDYTLTANFERRAGQYTLVVSASDGGTATGSGTFPQGANAPITATVTDHGCTFTGWVGAGIANSNAANTTILMDRNRTVIANFHCEEIVEPDPIRHTLTTGVSPEGSGTVNPVGTTTHNVATQVTITATPGDGYVFAGWSVATLPAISPITIAIVNDTAITAIFEPIPPNHYALTVERNPVAGGTVTRTPNLTSYEHGATVTVTATPATGYRFTGWSGAVTSADTSITITIDDYMALTATFELLTYTLATDVTPADGGSVIRNPNNSTGYPNGTYTHGATVFVTARASAGYMFTGWSDASLLADTLISITMTDDLELTAIFELIPPNHYTLTTERNPVAGGTVTRTPNLTSYQEGAEVIITATPNTGYRFTGWTGAMASTDSSITVTMNNDMTLTASFELLTYTLTTDITPAGGGSVIRNPNQTNYNHGTTVTITARPNASYRFIGWSGASSSTDTSVTITMTGVRELTAMFEEEIITHTLTVTASPTSCATALTGGGSHNAGANASISATAAASCTFTGWTGAGITDVSSASTTVLMDANKTVTANFTQQQDTSGGDDITITVNDVSFDMVFVDGGTFTMGCVDGRDNNVDLSCYDWESPSHQV